VFKLIKNLWVKRSLKIAVATPSQVKTDQVSLLTLQRYHSIVASNTPDTK